MKVAILVLALVALTASVAYAAPEIESEDAEIEDAEIESLLREIMNKDREEQNTGEIESLPQGEEDEDNEAILQEFYAREQVPVEIQGWFRKAIRKVGHLGYKKYHPFGRRVYKAYKCYKG